ncbi:MAG: hypothetical protein IKD46_07350 [Lentisphaeria bacterium]|nr:hypothetical protein [Lentisphaeria bacterium]
MEKMLMLAVLGICTGVVGADLAASQRGTLSRQLLSAQHTAGQAEHLVREANKLFLEDKYQDAIARYIEAKQLFERFKSEDFAKKVKICDDQIRKCYSLLAEEAYKAADKSAAAKDFDAALAAVREAAKLYPEGESRAKAKIAELETRKKAAAVREATGTDALMPGREAQVYRIGVLLRQGQELARAGRFAEAAQKFNNILMIDPYHAVALQNLKAANIRNRKFAESRYRTEHRKVITETEWRWAVPGVTEAAEAEEATDGPVEKDVDDNTSELEKKIKSIILPEFKVEKCTISAVVRALQEASRIYDPEKGTDARHGRGVNIFLRRPNALQALQQPKAEDGMDMPADPAMDAAMPAPAPAPAAPAPAPGDAGLGEDDEDAEEGEVGAGANEPTVTMDVRKRSLESALRELCRTAKLRMRIDSHAVVLAPENVALDDMETALYPVEKAIFGSIDPNDKTALQNFFKEHNIPFPQGAKAAYVSLLSRLVVTNTAENLAAVQALLQELHEDREPLVEVTAKFMEVQQSNLKELGFQYSLSYNSANINNREGASSYRLSFADAGSGLLRSSDTSGNGSLIMLSGNSGGPDALNYSVNVNALNQLSSSDALASPRIITLPGVPATIKMVRKVPFVDEYDDGEREFGNSDSDNNAYQTYTEIGPMPSFEDPTELGITMDVLPEINKEAGKITLDLKPQVRTQVGWTTWSYTSMDGTMEAMRKPIIAERNITTKVTVNDGKTIVVGGVVDDTSNTIDDKIPILGDLPLVGRFFRSRYTDADKRHLLIFITCRLINPDGTSYYRAKVSADGLPHEGRLN